MYDLDETETENDSETYPVGTAPGGTRTVGEPAEGREAASCSDNREQGPLCTADSGTEQEQRYKLKSPCLGVQALCALAKVCLPLRAEEGSDQVSLGLMRAANTEVLLEIAAGIDDVPVVVARRDLLGEVS